jgi:hypothetical protein
MIKDKALKLVNELIAENKALKSALAQPEQEPDHGDELTIAYMSGVHRGKELAAQPAQEPWCMKINGCKTKCEDCPDEPAQEPDYWLGYGLQAHTEKPFEGATPLYTTPQQRPWVGLTDEERDAITDKVIGFNSCCGWEDDYAKAIEAKLKEKNT